MLALDEQARSLRLTEEDTARRRQFAARAIELLDAAAVHGPFLESENAEWLMQDPDLKSLREEFDFHRLIESDD